MPQEVLADETDVVSALRNGLAARIGRDRFELWFGSNVQWELADDLVVVKVANTFLLDRVRRQFTTDIDVAVQTICGTSVRTEFRVDQAIPIVGIPAVIPQTTSLSSAPGLNRSGFTLGSVHPSSVVLRTEPATTPKEKPPRRPMVQLSTFVMGDGNRVANTAAQSCVQRPGVASPLFFYGPPGSGKSHLLEGICNGVRSSTSGTRALYLSADQFTCHFLEALQGSGLPNFRRKCREVDLLAVDDIHFFAGKKATLLEFQHTLDALYRQGKQVVVATDRAPAELRPLGVELVTRLTGGLVCGIEWADYETRLEIARQLVNRGQHPMPDEVIRLIAAETSGDARQIQGALNRLRATSEALEKPISLELATTALQDIFSATRRMVHLTDVERAVCEVFGMESKALRDGGKSKSISQPRMLAMWLSRKYTRAAFSEIGEYFGRRSHSTVISAERKVDRWVADGVKLQLGRACWSVEDAIRRIEMKLRSG